MKIKNFLIIAFLLLSAIGFGCRGVDKTGSEVSGCLTPNGEKIGLSELTKAYLFDAKDGTLLMTIEADRKYAAMACSQKNEVLAVYSDEIFNLETGEKFPRRIAESNVIGISPKNLLVSYNGAKNPGKRGYEAEVLTEQTGDQSDDLQQFKLPLESLDANERNKRSYHTEPFAISDDNELLVFAGGSAREIPLEEGDTNPDMWGFYKMNLENGEIQRTKVVDKAEDLISIFRPPTMAMTKDGKFAAAGFKNADIKILSVFDLETGEETLRQEYEKNRATGRRFYQLESFNSLAFSKDGTKLAIASVWAESAGKTYRKETVVKIFDLQTKTEINSYIFDEDIISIINFENDELLINFGKSIAKINVTDGKEIWKTSISKR